MKSLKTVLVLCICAVFAANLTANGEKEAGAANSGLEDIVYWNGGVDDPDKSIYEYAVEAYNSLPDRKYNIKNVPTMNDNYKEKLVIAMSSGQCPDIYSSWSGGPMIEYIKAGFAQPLDDLFAGSQAEKNLMDAAVAQGSYDGHLYALGMLNVSLSGVFYNKEMYDKYGLSVPETIGELEKNCDVLVQNGITPFALANASKWTGSMYFMNLATRYDGLEPFKAAADGTGTFEHESYVYAGEKIQEWVKKGYFPEGVNSLSEDDGQARQLLYQETAAMSCIGNWYVGVMMNDSKEFYDKMGWFPFPALEGSDADASIQIELSGITSSPLTVPATNWLKPSKWPIFTTMTSLSPIWLKWVKFPL